MYKRSDLPLCVLILVSVLATTRSSNITFECPEKWEKIGTHCYNFVNISMDFEDARDVCDKYGAQLLVIRDEVEAQNVSNLALKTFYPNKNFWIYNGTYEQDTGSLNSTLCRGMWQPNEPRETNENVAIASNMQGRWALTWVWTNLPFVCRTPACPRGSFRCSDGACLNMKWKCDGAYDCEDLSDENDCSDGVKYYRNGSGTVDTSTMANGDFYQWTIEGQPGEILQIKFETLTIEDHVDVVGVYSGGPSVVTSDLIKEIRTSQSEKLSVFSKNHFVIVTLQTYAKKSHQAVKFNWISDPEVSWQQVNIVNVTDNDSLISSPYYNSSLTPKSYKREWLLVVPEGELITLEILDNTLELNASSDFYIVTSVGFVLKELNSHKAIYISNKNSMSVILKTRSLKNDFNFSAIVRTGCDFIANLTLATFTLENFPANHSCSWTLINKMGTNFHLQINETSSGLSKDLFQINSSTDRAYTPVVDTLNSSTIGINKYDAPSGVFSLTYLSDTFLPTMEFTGILSTDCTDLQSLKVNVSNKTNTTDGSYKAQLSCPEGFRFKQEEYSNNTTLSAVCNESGRWDWGSPSYTRTPECQIVYCGFPPTIPNGFVSSIYGNVTYNSVASYQCFSGFGIVDYPNVTCQVDGSWSRPPSCVAQNCSEIQNITHGSSSNSSDVSEGSVVTFSCDPGYSLQGARTIACLSNKTWSHPQPNCKELTCPLPVIEHGRYEPTSIPKFGESVNLVCDSGYQINRTQTQNDTSITCSFNRTLSVENDTCVDVDECSLGVCNQSCKNLPGSYFCSCDQGYVLYTKNGTNGFYIPAGKDGLKPGDVFQINYTCVPVTCDKEPEAPANGAVLLSNSTYYFNETVNVVCSFRFILETPSVATCQSDGNWKYSAQPICKKLTCPQSGLPVSKHEVARFPTSGDIEQGASLTITCNLNDGSGNVTNKTAFCAPSPDGSGNFSLQGDNLTCPEINCGKPLEIHGGNAANVANTTYGSSFEFACDSNKGFVMKGASTLGNTTVVCQSNGRWGFANLTCEGPRCKDPGTRAGTIQIVKTSYEIDQVVQYNCTTLGFNTTTNNTLVCEYRNGKAEWSAEPPTCEDDEPPIINCSTVKPFDLYSTLEYPEPTVTDNSDLSCFIPESGPPSGVLLVTNNTAVRFKANDTRSEVFCEYNITVKDRTEPTIKCPPAEIPIDLAGSSYKLVNLTEQIHVSHSGDGTIMFDPVGPLNLTLESVIAVRVNITKENGLVKGCAFLVRDVSTVCSNNSLPVLDNGRIENCTSNGNKTTCVGVCDKDYLFQNGTNSTIYTCVNGVWDADSALHSCIQMQNRIYKYQVVVKYNLNGSTHSIPTQYNSKLCLDRHCSVLLQQVGSISACGFNNFTAISCSSKEQTKTLGKTTFILQLLTTDENETLLQNCADTLENQSLTLFGPTYPVIGNISCLSPWSVNSSNVTFLPTNISCSNNSWMVDYNGKKHCFPCGRGTFFNTTTETCQQCQDGFYQDEEGQAICKKCSDGVLKSRAPRMKESHCYKFCLEGFTSTSGYLEDNCTACPEDHYSNSSNSCQPCPNNGSTLGIQGATSVDQCSDPCLPGEYSITGYKPCSACPRNFFSDSQASKICNECSSDTVTTGNGSTSVADCVNGSSLCTDDFCYPNGTKNNSVCEIVDHRPVCSCKPGFYGDSCNKSCDVCNTNPCYNGGLCAASAIGPGFTCTCKNETNCTFSANPHIELITDPKIVQYLSMGKDECRDKCLINTSCIAYSTDNGAMCLHYKTRRLDPTSNNIYESYDKICSEKPLFDGPLCEEDLINDCNDTSVCTNPDFCRDLINGTECHCPNDGGSYDSNCAQPDDLCLNNNCSLNGKCIPYGSVRTVCECDSGYTGDNCETNINECDLNSQGCLYNGSCQDGINNYSCSCVDGFSGSHCEIQADFCYHNNCNVAHGGMCTNNFQNVTASCTCGEHYMPDPLNPGACVPIDYCLSNPCVNGTCTNVTGGFSCHCDPGFEGSHCQHNIDDCVSHKCENGATCLDGVSNYTCSCLAGFTGSFCDENINDCPGKCVLNNTESNCQDLVDDYYCPCKPAYTGKNCSVAVNVCSVYEPCLHGGNCSDFAGGYNCTCAAGWTGVNCEQEIDYCTPNPCQNSGTCFNLVDRYFCKCPNGTSGENCTLTEKLCDKSVCSLNGHCNSSGSTVRCHCLEEYTGIACELEKDHCAGDPCNGGICTQNHTTYVCDCSNVPGYSGKNCNETEWTCSACPNTTSCREFKDQDGFSRLSCMCKANETLVGDTCQTVDRDYDLAFLESFGNKRTFLTSESGFYLERNTSLTVSMWVAAAKPLDGDQFVLALRSSEMNSSFLSIFNRRVQFTTNQNISVNLTDNIGTQYSLDKSFNWHFLSIAWSSNGSIEIRFDFIKLNETRFASPPSEKFVFVQLGQSFYGYISQVSVWKTVLTSDEQLKIYNNTLAVPQPDSLILGWTQYSSDISVKKTRNSTAAGSFSICNITNTIVHMGLKSPKCGNKNFTDKTPPQVNNCSVSIVMPVDYSKHQVNSSELGYEFTDDTDGKLLTEGHLISYGAYDIAVSAEDSAGNIGVCMTRAYVTPNQCGDTEPSQGLVDKCSDNINGNKVTCPAGMLPSVPTPKFVMCGKLLTYNLDNMYEKPDRIVCGGRKPLTVTVNMTLPYRIKVNCDSYLIKTIDDYLISAIKTQNITWKGLCSDTNCSNVNASGHCTGPDSLDAYLQINGLKESLSSPGHPTMTPLEVMSVAARDTFNFSRVADAYLEYKNTKIDDFFSCDKGYTPSGLHCVQCGNGSYYDEGEMQCKLCELNTYSDHPGNTSCTPCPNNTITLQRGSSTSDDCEEKCQLGQMLNLTTDQCVACPRNFYQDHEGKSYCFPCPPATGTVANGSRSLDDCIDYCPEGEEYINGTCVSCSDDHYKQTSGFDQCINCTGDFTSTPSNRSYCSEIFCDVGRELTAGNCSDCDYGFFKPSRGNDSCIPCPPSTTTASKASTSDLNCSVVLCPAGSYQNESTNNCSLCERGTYQELSGQNNCTSCLPNYTTQFEGSVASSQCYVFCDVGRELISGNCSDCDYGFYKPSRGNYSCIPCPSNTTTASKASTSDLNCSVVLCPAGSYLNESTNNCSLCERGTYQELPGQNNCTSCLPNYTTHFEGSVASSQCYEICQQGNYRNATNDCVPCPVGQYQNESEQTSCKVCGNITGYNVSTVSIQTVNESDCFPICPEGFYLDKGNQSCLPCRVGTYKNTSNLDTSCEPCKPNFTTVYENETSSDACILDKCKKGYYRDVNSTECRPCPVGEFQDSDVLLNITTCTKCPSGNTTLFEGAPIKDGYCIQNCSKGEEYHITFKNCSVCPLGMYRPEGVREPPTCLLCKPGFTTLGIGETKCTPNQESALPGSKIDLSLVVTLNVKECLNLPVVINGTKKVILQLIENQNNRYDGICPSTCSSHLQIEIDSLCGESVRSKRQAQTSGNATVNVTVKQTDAVVTGKDGQPRPSMAALMEAFYDLYPVDNLLKNYLLSVDSVKGIKCGQGCFVSSFHYPQLCALGQYVAVDKCQQCAKGSYSTDPVSDKCKPCPDGQTTTGTGYNASSCDGICASNKNYCGNNGNCTVDSNNKSYCDCHSNYNGYACSQRKEPEDSNIKIIVGVTVGVGGFLLILLIICAVFAYRRKAAESESTSTSEESESDITHFRFPTFNPVKKWFDPLLYHGETLYLHDRSPSVNFKHSGSSEIPL